MSNLAVKADKKQNPDFSLLAQSAGINTWPGNSACASPCLLLLLKDDSSLEILTASPLPTVMLERNVFWNLTALRHHALEVFAYA